MDLIHGQYDPSLCYRETKGCLLHFLEAGQDMSCLVSSDHVLLVQ